MRYLPFETIKRKILIKDSSVKISKLKPRSNEELLNYGIVPLNKPQGPVSSEVVEEVKKILCISKAGHAGTLDPGVTGVLPIGINKSTKLLYYLLMGGKKYKGTMHFHKDVSVEQINNTITKFIGKINQKPPIRSSVRRKTRERQVYYLNILKLKKRDLFFEVGCESGTYIRKLCHDIGKSMGVGAHMTALERIQHGAIKLKDCMTLVELKTEFEKNNFKKLILSPEKALSHLPRIWVDNKTEDKIKHGSPVYIPGVVWLESEIKKDDFVMILSEKSKIIAVGKAQVNSKEMLSFKKGPAILLTTVVDAK